MSSLIDLKKQIKMRRFAMKSARGAIDIPIENPTINKIIQILTGFKNGKTTKDILELGTSIQALPVSDEVKLKEAIMIKFGCKSQQFLYINALLENKNKKIIKKAPKTVFPPIATTIVEASGHERKKLQLVT